MSVGREMSVGRGMSVGREMSVGRGMSVERGGFVGRLWVQWRDQSDCSHPIFINIIKWIRCVTFFYQSGFIRILLNIPNDIF